MLWIVTLFRNRAQASPFYQSHLTLLIPAHNEEKYISQCLRAVIESDYPSDKMNVLVVSDGSTDRTNEIVDSFYQFGVRLVALKVRRGKYSALCSVLDSIDTEVLVMMDASTILKFDAISRLVRHFQDDTIGSTVGARTIMQTGTTVSKSDSLYWKYESMLRALESRTGSSWVGVDGGLFAIRKELLTMDLSKGLSTDLLLGFHLCAKGFRNHYDSTALFWEPPSQNLSTEFFRKIRVIVRGIRVFVFHWRMLNPFVRPDFCFQNISHKLLRWLVPFFMLGIFAGCMMSESTFFILLLYAQIAFYMLAASALVLKRYGIKSWLTSIPLYFCSMNAAALVAWFVLFRRFNTWTRTQRSHMVD